MPSGSATRRSPTNGWVRPRPRCRIPGPPSFRIRRAWKFDASCWNTIRAIGVAARCVRQPGRSRRQPGCAVALARRRAKLPGGGGVRAAARRAGCEQRRLAARPGGAGRQTRPDPARAETRRAGSRRLVSPREACPRSWWRQPDEARARALLAMSLSHLGQTLAQQGPVPAEARAVLEKSALRSGVAKRGCLPRSAAGKCLKRSRIVLSKLASAR